MFSIDKYQSASYISGTTFSLLRDGNTSGKDIKTSPEKYIQLYEDYISCDTDDISIVETSSKVRPLRLVASGDLRTILENESDMVNFYEFLTEIVKLDWCGVFISPGSICFHFPNNVYSHKKYNLVANKIKNKLIEKYDSVDVEDDISFEGLDGKYTVLKTETCDPCQYYLDTTLPLMTGISDLNISPRCHKAFEMTSYKSSFSDRLLDPLVFSPTFTGFVLELGTASSSYSKVSSRISESTMTSVSSIDCDTIQTWKNDCPKLVSQELTNQLSHSSNIVLSLKDIPEDMAKFVPRSGHNVLDLNHDGYRETNLSEFDNVYEETLKNVNFQNLASEISQSDEYKQQKIKELIAIEHAYNLPIGSSESRGQAIYLMFMIDPARFHDESCRKEIGAAIMNSFPDSNEALSMWISFNHKSQRNKKKFELEKEWTNIKPIYSVLTLAHYAKRDNPVAYELWHAKWILEVINEAVKNRTDVDIAEMIYRINWLKFVKIRDRWYTMSPYKCSLIVVSESWINKFITEILFSEAYKWPIGIDSFKTYKEIVEDTSDTSLREFATDLVVLRRTLKNNTTLRNVKNQCNYFFESKIEKEFNSDPSKTAWINAVTIVTTSTLTVDDPKLEDYIDKNTNCRIAENTSDPMYHKVVQYMKDVFPEGLDENMVTDFAGLLRGVPEKKFKILSGINANSKTCVLALLEYTFGEYFHTINIQALEGLKGGSANPELASAVGCRILAINDPDPNATLGMAMIKAITGGDSIYVRKLHDNGGCIKSTFRIYMACNAIPRLSNADVGGADRLLVCPFLARWVSDINDPKYKEEKYLRQQDPDFINKLEDMAPYFARLLIENYSFYADDIKSCERYKHPLIQSETAKQWSNVNPFINMFKHKYEQNDDATFTLQEVITDFNMSVSPQEKSTNQTWFENQLRGMGICESEDVPGTYIGWCSIKNTEL